MKQLSILLIVFLAAMLTATTCNKGNSTGSGNGAATHDSTAVVEDTTAVVEDTLLPTGGIKPLPVTPEAVREKLYNQYKNGEIEQCMHNGNTVYRCSRNAPDAGSEVFDHQGNQIGKCYYSTRQVDPVCKEATDCKVIYRMAKNIWGKPEVPWKGN